MKDLAIVCPTRHRPESCQRMIRSAVKTSSSDIVLYVDSDDTPPDLSEFGERVTLYVGEPIGRGHAVNVICDKFRDYRAYLVITDDMTFDRPGWEQQTIAALDSFGDDIGCVHLQEGNGAEYVNWACVSRRWIDTLGWFNFPKCGSFCQDTIIQCLAVALDRVRFIRPPVLTHHIENHPDVAGRFAADCIAFLWYMAQNFPGDLAKLKKVMKTP